MAGKSREKFLNRELSWLEFNHRVLELARDDRIPILERVKFLAITGSNLDEFFMVRVGGLQALVQQKNINMDASGRTPAQQLDAIRARTETIVADQYVCYGQTLEPLLAQQGIRRMYSHELNETQRKHVETLFESEIMPVLSPISISAEMPVTLLANKTLHIVARIKNESTDKPASYQFIVIPVPNNLERFVALPAEGFFAFMLLEDIIKMCIEKFFAQAVVMECSVFRITRNADMSVREDLAFDLLAEMEAVLDARERSSCVRLEVEEPMSQTTLHFLHRVLETGDLSTYRLGGPIDLSAFMRIASLGGHDHLRYQPWPPCPIPSIRNGQSMFDAIRASNILLYHPYESFDPVQKFLEQAADDPDVMAIKQVLYRTSRKSPIVAALARAAEKGKYVTALVELKARFDEERNIEWARELEDSGVQVIYGLKGLKTHAKICIVLRKEPQGLQRYMHFGTGNYNEITARMYSDISFMSCDDDLGDDSSAFFNTITGYSQPRQYRKLEAAPIGMRKKLISLIEAESERKSQGQKAHIMAKMNSLVDGRIIRALYAASKAGVRIQLNIRGICCLRPGVRGLSENITVTSIVDRYLEHARIFCFHNGGDERVFISSADWMPRNLDRRVELLVPVEDTECRRKLIRILETHLADTVNAWQLKSDGSYTRMTTPDKKLQVQSQEALYLQACGQAEQNRGQRIVFEPLRPPLPK